MNMKELSDDFRKMGYTPFSVKMERPNYYRLEDGSILRVYSILNAIEMDPAKPDGIGINAQNIVTAYTPKRLRGTPTNETYTSQEMMKNFDLEDMKFTILQEDFNEYDLDGKFVFSLKTSLTQVSRCKLFNQKGEPLYMVNTAVIPKIKQKKQRSV